MIVSEVASPEDRLLHLAARLKELANTQAANRDFRAICSYALGEMQEIMVEQIRDTAPTFEHPEWVADLAEALHGYYLDACAAWDRQQLTSPAYTAVFEALSAKAPPTVLEALVYPLVIHIGRDLPKALIDVGFGDPTGSHLRDYQRINDILAGAIDRVQKLLHDRYDPRWVPMIRHLDRLGGGCDEILTDLGFRVSRGAAWYTAIRILDPDSTTVDEEIEQRPAKIIAMVRRPPRARWLEQFLRLTRWFYARLPRRWDTT
jgi:hypothetical protein